MAAMGTSAQLQAAHAVLSPCGKYIAAISNGRLRLFACHASERFSEFTIRVQARDIVTLRWDAKSGRICVLSSRMIEVVDVNESAYRIRLDNGTGGLGGFVAAEFAGDEQLLVVWEFGRAKVWNLSDGKGVELGDLKMTCPGERWQLRPCAGAGARRILATISRPGAEDLLSIHCPKSQTTLSVQKLPTVDAQTLSWSPDGRWLAILDTPAASTGVHMYTPDGHHFRSYAAPVEDEVSSLGFKTLAWSGNSQTLALTRFDGRIILLNTRTFTPLAIIEHTTTVDQNHLRKSQRAQVWQEIVSATSMRSYNLVPQPVSPPLSRTKPTAEPIEPGVAEVRFSCDGSFLATRDERMLNTVWIWNMATLSAHTVLMQHSNVRRMQWHPSRADMLMLDCGEGVAYIFDAVSSLPPNPMPTSMPTTSTLDFMLTMSNELPGILATARSSFRFLFPEGRPGCFSSAATQKAQTVEQNDSIDDLPAQEAGDDSLFDLLSGRTPMHPKTEQSYTERVDVEVGTEDEEAMAGMDDTFREKKLKRLEVDPFDDSEIF